LLPDITLSCSASGYIWQMGMPLTVDLAGPRNSVRCYFVADGRNDPYGKKPIPDGSNHKPLHLDPFWAAAQRETDALCLAIYRDYDIPANAVVLNSNFVMPLDADEILVGTERVHFVKNQKLRVEVRPGQVVALRKNNAALALRVPWACGSGSSPASIALVYDGNRFGAVRLVVEHGLPSHTTSAAPARGAAFWLRIGSSLRDETAFNSWLKQFTDALFHMDIQPDRIQIDVSGLSGPLEVSAEAPWMQPDKLEPAPSRAVLELNGRDVGEEILDKMQTEH
jgi:hypothetical protein